MAPVFYACVRGKFVFWEICSAIVILHVVASDAAAFFSDYEG